ncbi:MAG: D-TA family PLP-dependent enzyme, partial [Chitinophagaceae bacterium]
KSACDLEMAPVFELQKSLEKSLGRPIKMVAGGTPTFCIQAARAAEPAERGLIECSPGTFIFWDEGYANQLPDLPFEPAAVLITRVISIVDEHTICTDLGHKSVASEMPFPRVAFLNAPGATAIGHSEEHLTIQVSNSAVYKPGDCIYCLPRHICPTVALYEKVYVVEDNAVTGNWKTVARDRYINI